MKLSVLQFSFCASLLIHGGIFGAVYAVQHRYSPASVKVYGADSVSELVLDEPEQVISSTVSSADSPTALKEPECTRQPDSSPIPIVTREPAADALAAAPIEDFQDEVENQSEPIFSGEAAVESTASPSVNPHEVPTGTAGVENTPVGYLINPKPSYPDEARRHRQQGLVIVSITVNDQGKPAFVELTQSSGYQLLDEAATAAVKHWQFTPARSDSIARASRVQIPIRFALSD
jgi:periplasmic protein TonB